MSPISRILVPVDFSARSLGIMPYVRLIATKYDSEVILLHVVNPIYTIPQTGVSGTTLLPLPQSHFTHHANELETFAAAELTGLNVRRVLYEGEPEAQIAEFTQTENIDLVIMPTHGRGVFRRFLIGSVTSKVLHDVTCPMLTGAHMETQPSLREVQLRNIVCAIDLQGHSAAVLRAASRFAEDFAAKLKIVYVTGAGRETARREVEMLLNDSGIKNAEVAIEGGDIARQVSAVANSMPADLVVIGRGKHDEKRGRLRTNAYAIIHQAPCPVLSV